MANTKIKFNFNQTKVTVTTAEFLLGIYNPVEVTTYYLSQGIQFIIQDLLAS